MTSWPKRQTLYPLLVKPRFILPWLWETLAVSTQWLILTFHTNGIISTSFCGWLLSLIFSRFDHTVAGINTSFLFVGCMLSRFSCIWWLFVTWWTTARQASSKGFSRQEYWSGFMNNILLYGYITFYQFIDIWVVSFLVLWIICYEHLCISFEYLFSVLLGTYAGAELLGCRLCVISRNCPTVFQSAWAILHSLQQGPRVPIFPHPIQHLLFSIFLIITTLVGVEWYPTVGLICIPQWLTMLSIFIKCLLAICKSLEKCLFKSFALIQVGYLSLLNYKYSSSILDISPLSDIWLQIFSSMFLAVSSLS